ncbi:PstS family phosphate ABC transporter substrate-binding protein [Coleofasciculus sp. H7-2]|uniref:PstS family phosphate ABC transporter substrate-binding protein n=1 Tax=Coleofasciculus sp. H7-2 TaxID=3351545 RepID=UPI00366D8AAC
MKAITFRWAIALGVLALTTSCTAPLNSSSQAQQPPPQVKVDGSSTVYPITNAIAAEFQANQANKNNNKNKNADITVSISGTGGGFKKFCTGETDISNASRPILTDEMEACNKAGVRYIELPVAFDALTVVVNTQNNWAKDITVAELKKMWEPGAQGKITRWNQIRAEWPDRPLNLYGADKESGTFDYFTEATVGTVKASRSDYTASEDDNVLVQGVSKDPNALGYFGLAYYEANPGQLKALAVDNGKQPVLPSRQTVENADYQPLSRPLFIYVNAKSAQNNQAVHDFVEFYLKNAPTLVSKVGYVPLPGEGYHLAWVHFNRGKVGTVFGGEAQLNLTIGELLRKQATF